MFLINLLLLILFLQDKDDAAKPEEVARLLRLQDLPSNRRWHIQGCCALSGHGLTEGFRWLGANVQ